MENLKSFQDFIDLAFYGLVSGGITLMVSTLQKLSNSTTKLNEQLATVIERLSTHDARLSNLERREKECTNYKCEAE